MPKPKQKPPEPKFAATEAQYAAAIKKARGLLSAAAEALGVDRRTVYRAIERWPDLQAVVEEARERMTDLAEASLYQKVTAGEPWAVQFYLKTQGKHRGYVERTEFAGVGDQPITVNVTRRVVPSPEKVADPHEGSVS